MIYNSNKKEGVDMIKIALLENEHTAKEIIYALGMLLNKHEWLFRCYLKASELAAAQQQEHFDLIIPVFRSLHHISFEASKSRYSNKCLFIALFLCLKLFLFFYFYVIIMVSWCYVSRCPYGFFLKEN